LRHRSSDALIRNWSFSAISKARVFIGSGWQWLRKKYCLRRSLTSAAKADSENKPSIAAVNRCATQNQVQHRLFPQAVKLVPFPFVEGFGGQ
jgi:hypothetical protein